MMWWHVCLFCDGCMLYGYPDIDHLACMLYFVCFMYGWFKLQDNICGYQVFWGKQKIKKIEK